MENLWTEYYQAFPYFSQELVREGCQPRKMVHGSGSDRAIVLVHGLTDSAWYMTALADHFHHRLGYDVYLPLLHMHGLREPHQMLGVSLEQWQENVRFAIDVAAKQSSLVAVGGLSTGGGLALHAKLTNPAVSGDLYLFSAALGLSGAFLIVPGKLKEYLLRIPGITIFDSHKPLIGENPYRYERVPLNSAAELAKLIGLNNKLIREAVCDKRHLPRTFAAWTEADRVVSIQALKRFGRFVGGDFSAFVIPEKYRLEHACVVLLRDVYANDADRRVKPLEKHNPLFAQMLSAIDTFARE